MPFSPSLWIFLFICLPSLSHFYQLSTGVHQLTPRSPSSETLRGPNCKNWTHSRRQGWTSRDLGRRQIANWGWSRPGQERRKRYKSRWCEEGVGQCGSVKIADVCVNGVKWTWLNYRVRVRSWNGMDFSSFDQLRFYESYTKIVYLSVSLKTF